MTGGLGVFGEASLGGLFVLGNRLATGVGADAPSFTLRFPSGRTDAGGGRYLTATGLPYGYEEDAAEGEDGLAVGLFGVVGGDVVGVLLDEGGALGVGEGV